MINLFALDSKKKVIVFSLLLLFLTTCDFSRANFFFSARAADISVSCSGVDHCKLPECIDKADKFQWAVNRYAQSRNTANRMQVQNTFAAFLSFLGMMGSNNWFGRGASGGWATYSAWNIFVEADKYRDYRDADTSRSTGIPRELALACENELGGCEEQKKLASKIRAHQVCDAMLRYKVEPEER